MEPEVIKRLDVLLDEAKNHTSNAIESFDKIANNIEFTDEIRKTASKVSEALRIDYNEVERIRKFKR